MQEDVANLVHPIMSYGLALRDRLHAGQRPTLTTEQAALKGLLLSEREAERWPLFGGETGAAEISGAAADVFLGVRYALVCWLDELFVLDSPWQEQWNEFKLEMSLYRTNDRAWRFWEQARLAEMRPDTDALEVFYLCVMLGFQGELSEQPERLRDWTATAHARVAQVSGREWSAPPEVEPPTRVPPLRGRDRFERMVMAAGIGLLVLVPVLAFFVVRKIGQ